MEKQQELLRTVYNVVTRRGACVGSRARRPRHARLRPMPVRAAADNLCSFVEDEATFGKARGGAAQLAAPRATR